MSSTRNSEARPCAASATTNTLSASSDLKTYIETKPGNPCTYPSLLANRSTTCPAAPSSTITPKSKSTWHAETKPPSSQTTSSAPRTGVREKKSQKRMRVARISVGSAQRPLSPGPTGVGCPPGSGGRQVVPGSGIAFIYDADSSRHHLKMDGLCRRMVNRGRASRIAIRRRARIQCAPPPLARLSQSTPITGHAWSIDSCPSGCAGAGS